MDTKSPGTSQEEEGDNMVNMGQLLWYFDQVLSEEWNNWNDTQQREFWRNTLTHIGYAEQHWSMLLSHLGLLEYFPDHCKHLRGERAMAKEAEDYQAMLLKSMRRLLPHYEEEYMPPPQQLPPQQQGLTKKPSQSEMVIKVGDI